MSGPWLSVLMPVFNGAATLERTLDSLARQSEGIEVIAVDQASGDGSRALLQARAADLNLTIIDASESRSWMRNTNIALKAARAPLVTMLHQDDLWRPNRADALRRMAEEQPGVRLWLHAADYIDAEDRVIGRAAPPFGPRPSVLTGADALTHLLVQNTVALPSAMFRREDALSFGGLDETLWYTADWDLWLRLARLGRVSWMPEALAAFRVHRGSLTMTGSRDGPAFREQLEIPLARHLPALPAEESARVGRIAGLSNELNAALAGAYHDNGADLRATLLRIVALGPKGWRVFLRDTNIIGRVLPRLRLKLRKG